VLTFWREGKLIPVNRKIIQRLPAPVIAGGIWFLSSQSTLPQPKGILGFDKVQHLIAYLTLAAAAGLWVSPAMWRARRFLAIFLVTLAAALYGAVDEIHQSFTPGRDCNLWDWIADALGALLGAALIAWISIRSPGKTEKRRFKGPEK
jgi:VanZ family protein